MATKVYSYDVVHAAMCIWEEICVPSTEDSQPWFDMRQEVGYSQMRDYVIDHLAAACDAAYTRAHELYEQAIATWRDRRADCEARGVLFDDPEPEEPGSFDWEFVPFWLRTCVDWSGDKPRVLGSAGNG